MDFAKLTLLPVSESVGSVGVSRRARLVATFEVICSPGIILALFSLINLLTFFDLGLVAVAQLDIANDSSISYLTVNPPHNATVCGCTHILSNDSTSRYICPANTSATSTANTSSDEHLQAPQWCCGCHLINATAAAYEYECQGPASYATLSSAEGGLFGSAYVAGFLLAVPLFARLSVVLHPPLVLMLGKAIWSGGCLLCTAARSYSVLVLARCIVGCGDASFWSIAPMIIDASSPKDTRGARLGVFYACIPLGYALGYGAGDALVDALGWRSAWAFASICMAPLALLAALVPAQHRGRARGQAKTAAEEGAAAVRTSSPPGAGGGRVGGAGGGNEAAAWLAQWWSSSHEHVPRAPTPAAQREWFWHPGALLGRPSYLGVSAALALGGGAGRGGVIARGADGKAVRYGASAQGASGDEATAVGWEEDDEAGNFTLLRAGTRLLRNTEYVLLTLGYAACVFAVCGCGFWMPTYAESEVGASIEVIGALLVVIGVFGVVGGGALLDALGGFEGVLGLQRAVVFVCACIATGAIIGVLTLAHVGGTQWPALTVFLLFLTGLSLAAASSPIIAATFGMVSRRTRAAALVYQLLAVLGLGALPAPLAIGLLADALRVLYPRDAFRYAFMCALSSLVLAAVLCGAAAILVTRRKAAAAALPATTSPPTSAASSSARLPGHAPLSSPPSSSRTSAWPLELVRPTSEHLVPHGGRRSVPSVAATVPLKSLFDRAAAHAGARPAPTALSHSSFAALPISAMSVRTSLRPPSPPLPAIQTCQSSHSQLPEPEVSLAGAYHHPLAPCNASSRSLGLLPVGGRPPDTPASTPSPPRTPPIPSLSASLIRTSSPLPQPQASRVRAPLRPSLPRPPATQTHPPHVTERRGSPTFAHQALAPQRTSSRSLGLLPAGGRTGPGPPPSLMGPEHTTPSSTAPASHQPSPPHPSLPTSPVRVSSPMPSPRVRVSPQPSSPRPPPAAQPQRAELGGSPPCAQQVSTRSLGLLPVGSRPVSSITGPDAASTCAPRSALQPPCPQPRSFQSLLRPKSRSPQPLCGAPCVSSQSFVPNAAARPLSPRPPAPGLRAISPARCLRPAASPSPRISPAPASHPRHSDAASPTLPSPAFPPPLPHTGSASHLPPQ